MAKKKAKSDPKADRLKAVREFVKNNTSDQVSLSLGIGGRGRIPFGIPPIDRLTGSVARGSIVVFWGKEQTGKTTAALHLAANARANGDIVALVDAEGVHGENPIWLIQHGIMPDDPGFIYIKGAILEEVLPKVLSLIEQGLVDLVIIDSISSLVPRAEMESKKGVKRSLDDDTMALQARQVTKFGRHALAVGAGKNVTIVMIAQVYTNIGTYGGGYVMKLSTGMKHWSSMRLKFSRTEKSLWPSRTIDSDEHTIGFSSCITVEKVKQDGTMGEGASIILPFVDGFHMGQYLYNEALSRGIITNAGGRYKILDTNICRGKEAMTEMIYDKELQLVEKLAPLLYPDDVDQFITLVKRKEDARADAPERQIIETTEEQGETTEILEVDDE